MKIALGVAAGLLALAAIARYASSQQKRSVRMSFGPTEPEQPKRSNRSITAQGNEFDTKVDEAVAQLQPGHREIDGQADAVVQQLRELASRTVATGEDIKYEEAREQVASGDWTGHQIPAAFLAESPAGPAYPLFGWYGRLYAWVFPEQAFRNRVSRTTEVLVTYYEEQASPPRAVSAEQTTHLDRLREVIDND